MDIEIRDPVGIGFEIVDIDEKIPSLNIKLVINVNKFNYKLNVELFVWVDCSVFDNFLSEMKNDDVAFFKDMNGVFNLILNKKESFMDWSLVKESLGGSVVELKGKERLMDGDLSNVFDSFNGYPKWW